MTDATIEPSAATADRDLRRVADLLGGKRTLRHALRTPLDAHEMLLKGLPGTTLSVLIDNLVVIEWSDALERALGTSLRTFQRRKSAPAKPLTQDQSARTWKFAEILARATKVLGAQDDAEQWLERPAIGLARRRPIDLLATPAGTELVEDLLTRLEFGVYT